VQGLRRFAGRRRAKAERLKKERSSGLKGGTALKRAQKAEDSADEIAAKLRKLRDLKDQGNI
jgi:ribosomal protein L19E